MRVSEAHRFPSLVLVLLSALAALPAPAQQAATAEAPPPCAAAEHAQFDFWIGEWAVTSPDGQPIATNRIRRTLGGCALVEDSVVDGETLAHGLTYYDAVGGQWRHHWADCKGRWLSVAGGLEEGVMVLRGESSGPGVEAPVPIVGRWQVLPDGRVRQTFEASFDGGETWTEVFVGVHGR